MISCIPVCTNGMTKGTVSASRINLLKHEISYFKQHSQSKNTNVLMHIRTYPINHLASQGLEKLNAKQIEDRIREVKGIKHPLQFPSPAKRPFHLFLKFLFIKIIKVDPLPCLPSTQLKQNPKRFKWYRRHSYLPTPLFEEPMVFPPSRERLPSGNM